ncbi:MAG: 8-amino-7-oxononanoate synthase [Planctomycetes bacterium]|nr:8-amino-7-oxononanoate synthase [Planctomycetota bacterium]MDP6423557.1 pyridoxal phosphate-dependent aminotransferase family protein [Planctomycetota bacterium]
MSTTPANIWWRRARGLWSRWRFNKGGRDGSAPWRPGRHGHSPSASQRSAEVPSEVDLFAKCTDFTTPAELQQLGIYPYFHPISESDGTEVEIRGQRLVMVGSNNYLGVTQDARVREAAMQAISRYGPGCTGSRFLNGTLEMHEELEERLAHFLGRERVLVFTTGFQTNLGVISSLVQRNDTIFTDRENHASIMDGCRLSFGSIKKFAHNDIEALAQQLKRHRDQRRGGQLIVVDGVFSMLGDICELPPIVELAKRHGARVLVDDAHAVGVLGANGRGTAEHFGIDDKVDLVLGTFSKSFGSIGGYVAGDEDVIRYVKHHGRAMIFSAALPPASVAATLAALDIIEQEPERRTKLMENADFLRRSFQELGFDTGPSCTPIVPLIIGGREPTFRFWRELYDNGVFTNPITAPAVPSGMDLIRTSVMATHTREQLEQVVKVVAKAARKLRLVA